MSVVAKTVAAVAALGVGSVGSYLLVVNLKGMPDYTTVADVNSYTETTALGKGYKHILVDTSSNEGWWKWSYNRWLAESQKADNTLSDDFKNTDSDKKIEGAFGSETNAKTLNKVCDAAYKKKVTEAVDFGTGSEGKHKLGVDVLRFCSPIGQKPASIDNSENYDSGKIGGGSDKSALVSTTSKDNHHFWSAMQKYLMANKPTDEFFKRIGEQTIRSLCEEAYKSTQATDTASTTQPKLDDVKRYCSLTSIASTS